MIKNIVVPITALICITVLELYAMYKGFDGVLLGAVFAIVAGIGGYNIHKLKKM